MNCNEVQQVLHDYVDDQLTEVSRQSIDEHLGRCLTCRRELESLRSLLAAAQGLPSEIQPSTDLWPGVESRLPSARAVRPETTRLAQPERFRWLQLVAAVITLLVLSVPISVWWAGRDSDKVVSVPQIPTTAPEIGPELVAVQAEIARSEDGVMLAWTDLVTTIERQRDVIEEDTVRVFEENMNLLDLAIGEIRQALDEDPQNRRLRMLLAARYQQERKLLQKASRV